MSVIEDTRKVLQDFIAPELRAIDARLTSLEKRFEESQRHNDKRFDTMDKRFEAVDRRFEKLENHMNERFDTVLQTVDDRFEKILAEIRQLKSVHDLELRMAKYEAALSAGQQTQPAKSSSEAA